VKWGPGGDCTAAAGPARPAAPTYTPCQGEGSLGGGVSDVGGVVRRGRAPERLEFAISFCWTVASAATPVWLAEQYKVA
jgi:hypothetical protein